MVTEPAAAIPIRHVDVQPLTSNPDQRNFNNIWRRPAKPSSAEARRDPTVFSWEKVLPRLKEEIARGKTLVITNGHMTLMHPGHHIAIQEARRLAVEGRSDHDDNMVVELVIVNNREQALRKDQTKAPGLAEPIEPPVSRAINASSDPSADFVVISEAPVGDDSLVTDFQRLVQEGLINGNTFYVKGGDYTTDTATPSANVPPEARIVTEHGGKFLIAPRIGEDSTTATINHIKRMFETGQDDADYTDEVIDAGLELGSVRRLTFEQACNLFELRDNIDSSKPWWESWSEDVEKRFRYDPLIRTMNLWQERYLTEEEFFSLVYEQSQRSAEFYQDQDSRLLGNVVMQALMLRGGQHDPNSYLGRLEINPNIQLPTDDDYQFMPPIFLRQTIGSSETRENGSFYLHDGNTRMLKYAMHLISSGEPYVPVRAVIGTIDESSGPMVERSLSKGPLVVEGYAGRKEVPQHEVIDTFRNAEQLYFTLPPKIGDIVVATGFIRSIIELEKLLNLPRKDKIIIVPQSMHALLRPTCEALGITLMAGADSSSSQNRAEYLARDVLHKRAIIFELDATGGGKNPEGLYFGDGQLTIKNILPSLLSRYTVSEGGMNRQRLYMQDLFGVDYRDLDPISCQPGLEMMASGDTILGRLKKKYNIDPNRPQVAIIIETSEIGRQYSLEHWVEVARLIKEAHPQTEFNIIFDPKKQEIDETFLDRNDVLAKFNLILGQGQNPSTVRMVGEPLLDTLEFMRLQSVVVGNDTGIPHLIATSRGGRLPNVVTLFAAPQANPNQWVTSPHMKPLIPPADATQDPRGGIYCADPALKWINAIEPKTVASQALASWTSTQAAA